MGGGGIMHLVSQMNNTKGRMDNKCNGIAGKSEQDH